MNNSESKKDYNNLNNFDSYSQGLIVLGIISFIVSLILLVLVYVYLHEGVFNYKNSNPYSINTQIGFIYILVFTAIFISISIVINITNTILIKDVTDKNNKYYKTTTAFAIISGLLYILHMIFLNSIPINKEQIGSFLNLNPGKTFDFSRSLFGTAQFDTSHA